MKHHVIQYEVLNNSNLSSDTIVRWEVQSHATLNELRRFERTGYLILEGLFEGEKLQRLRDALDRLEERESKNRDEAVSKTTSWGFIPRRLMDKDQVFLDLLKFQPTLSIARAMMGPMVRIRGLSARISYPDAEQTYPTPWHQHLRVISDPLPPWFSRPHCIDCLIYLDDISHESGAIAVVPGSHDWLDQSTPDSYEPVDGELELHAKAGDVVMIHGNLWHRALPTLNTKRRVLILSYTPAWMRQSTQNGKKPKNGLTRQFLKDADYEERILLGTKEYT